MIYFCYLFTAIVLLVTGASSNVITIQANSNGPADPALDLLDPAANHSKWSAAVKSLSALSSEEFTTLQHPTFPSHSVRIKRVDDWCDSTVKYVDAPCINGYLLILLSFAVSTPGTWTIKPDISSS